MTEVGYGILPVVPSLKGAGEIINRELSAQSATAGMSAGKKIGAGISKGAAQGTRSSSIFSNVEKGAAVSGANAGKRFGTALHQTFGEYSKSIGAAAVGFFAFEKAKEFLGDVIKEGDQAQATQRLLEAHLASTGGTAGVTAEQIDKLAASQSKLIGVDRDTIVSGAAMLLTFANIRNEAGKNNDIFTRTLTTAEDMSASMGTSLPSALKQLGRAVNDPVHGLTSLTRAGVQFTTQQQTQIKALVASGHLLKAQRMVLDQLGVKFAGSARAADTPMKQLGADVKNFEQSLGQRAVPAINATAAGAVKLASGAASIPGPLKEAAVGYLAFAAAQKLGMTGAMSTRFVALRTQIAGTAVGMRTLAADAAIAGKSMLVAGANTDVETAAISRTRGAVASVGKGAAILGGLALVSSGATNKLGLTNTATLTLAGSMAGPLGAGVGAAVGGFMDAQKAASGLESELHAVASSDDASTLTKNLAALEAQRYKLNDTSSLSSAITNPIEDIGAAMHGHLSALWSTGFLNKPIDATKKKLMELQGSQQIAAAEQGAYGKTVQEATKAQVAEEKALQASRKAARAAGQSFVGVGKDVDNAKVSLGGWIREQRQQANALVNFTRNLETAAHRGLRDGLIKELEKAGPTGALRMAQLAHATKAEIRDANQSWLAGQRAVRHYTDVVGTVPRHAGTDLTVNGVSSALAAVQRIKGELSSVKPVYRTEFYVTQVNASNKGRHSRGGAIHRAGGGPSGPVFGAGTETSDSIPAMLSNHEFVERAAAVRKYGIGFMEAVNNGSYVPTAKITPRSSGSSSATVVHNHYTIQAKGRVPVQISLGSDLDSYIDARAEDVFARLG